MRRSAMDAASTQLWSSPSLWERRVRDSRSKPCRKNSSGGSRPQQLLHMWQEEKKEEENGKRCKCKEQPVVKWVHRRQVGAMQAFRLVLFLILLGSRMLTVKAVEQECSAHQEMDRKLGKVSVLRADSSNISRRNTARGRTPEPLERNRQG